MDLSQGSAILARQQEMTSTERKVCVINTSLFLMLDYFGNRDGFYDSVVMQIASKKDQKDAILQPV